MAWAACGGGDRVPVAAPRSEPAVPVAQPAPAPTPPAPTTPVLPDTPAGKTLAAWLDAFNSGDQARLEAFVAQHKFPRTAGEMMMFRNQTGGFELVAIEKTEPLALTFVVKEKTGTTKAVGWIKVKAGEPAEITFFDVLAIPPNLTAADVNVSIDAAARTRVIDGAIAKLTESYVYPETAKKMVQALRDHQKQGAYDAVTEAPALAALLTEHLQAVSHDRHLRVGFMPEKLPEIEQEPTDQEKADYKAELEKMNCGFEKVETLDGNIGYIKFNMFADAEICGAKATAAFGSLGNVDAVIFDLRDNGGGQPDMVAFVSSYLFAKRTHLNDLYDRKENKTTQYWTKPGVPGAKLAKQPVYVLTSSRTFSGAEEFSYNLKNLKRATIVGETTGGGAHPTMGRRIDDHFMIAVPFARAINPITKTNWEGTGVKPDVQVPAAEALDKAKQLAAEAIAKRKKSKP